jgi:group I intron endonuclease
VSAQLYTITRRETGEQYVGITSQKKGARWAQHKSQAKLGRVSHLSNALRKYGVDAFDYLEVAAFETYEQAQLAEMTSITFAQPVYNITAGGEGAPGLQHTAAARAKMSAARVGNQNSLGCKPGAETRAKLSAAKKGVPKSPEHRAAIGAAHVGMKRSPEACERMRQAQLQSRARRQALEMTAQKAG